MFLELQVPSFSEIVFASVTSLVIVGHNLWLIGKNEQTRIRVEANTGDHFPESDSAVKCERVADFRLVSPDGFAPITNYRVEETSLITDVISGNDRSFCVSLALFAHPITLEAEKFAGYIAEESAGEFVKPNFVAGDTTAPQRESYTKFAKVFIEGNRTQGEDVSALLAGHRLEIIPQIAPSKIDSNRKLPVQILFEGKPIAGLRVSTGCEGVNGGKYLSHEITDANGMANIAISDSGHWFARTHFIRPHSNKEDFEWESFWASVTFRV